MPCATNLHFRTLFFVHYDIWRNSTLVFYSSNLAWCPVFGLFCGYLNGSEAH